MVVKLFLGIIVFVLEIRIVGIKIIFYNLGSFKFIVEIDVF